MFQWKLRSVWADRLKAGLTTEWLKRRNKIKEKTRQFKADEIADAEAKELLTAQQF